jgi:sugar phosphate isomerase/epimerase
MRRPPILLSTGSLYTYGLARIFALAAEAGYDGVEVLVDHRWDTRGAAYLRRLATDHALPIRVLHSPFVVEVPGWPAGQLARLERTLALARTLEVPVVVTHLPFRFYAILATWHSLRPRRFMVPVLWPRREPYYHFLRNGRLEELESGHGALIGVENMPAHRLLGRRVNAYWFNQPDLLTRFPHLTLDTTHLGTWGMDPVTVYEQLKGHIVHVHLSNYDGREHRLPPDGHLPLDRLLRRMSSDGYRGAITVEADPGAMRVENERECLADLRRAVHFCQEHLAR